MLKIPALLAGTWFLSSMQVSCLAYTPDDLRNQNQAEWRLSDAPITHVVKERVLASLVEDHMDEYVDEEDDVKAIALRSTVKLVQLDRKGRIGIEVKVAAPWCGATGNCEVEIFDNKTGSPLVDDVGWDYGFRRTMHHGLYDFYIRANLSYCSGTLNVYHFDGRVFRQVDEIQEQKGCLSAGR
jgi:hypothetical protein